MILVAQVNALLRTMQMPENVIDMAIDRQFELESLRDARNQLEIAFNGVSRATDQRIEEFNYRQAHLDVLLQIWNPELYRRQMIAAYGANLMNGAIAGSFGSTPTGL